jgi:hypothetical protein
MIYYDAKITQEGSILITNDITRLSYYEYVAQAIYCGLMKVGQMVIEGKRITDVPTIVDDLTFMLKTYISSMFSSTIDVSGIEITVDDTMGSPRFVVSYSGVGLNGETVDNYQSEFPFILDNGIYRMMEMSPSWLSFGTLSESEHVIQHVMINEQTNIVRLNHIPTCIRYTTDECPYSDYIFLHENGCVTSDDIIEVSLNKDVVVYQLSRYTEDKTIIKATITSLSVPVDARIVLVGGEYTLVYNNPIDETVTATISCTLTTALQVTSYTIYSSSQGSVVKSVNPMMPLSIPVYASFGKVIRPGRYMIEYNKLIEPSSI